MGAIRRTGPAGPAVRRGTWRLRRRRRRGRCWSWRRSAACWRSSPIWRRSCWPARRCASPAARRSRRRLLPQIAEGSLRLAFAHGERQARYDLTDVLTTAQRKPRRLGARRREKRRGAWRQRRQADRQRPHRAASATIATASACFWSMPRRTAWRGAATRCATARAPPRSRCRASRSARDALLGEPGQGFADHRARRRGRHRRDRAPRRSARWKRCRR